MSLTTTKRPVSTRLLLTLAVALLTASGCTGKGVATGPVAPAKPTGTQAAPARHTTGPARGATPVAPVLEKRADAQLLPLTRTSTPAFVASSGGRNLTGTVAFEAVSHSFFGDSAVAAFRLLAMPAGHALMGLSTLDEDLYTNGGDVIHTASATNGDFSLNGAPGDGPFLVNASLAQSHRLSAIVLDGQNDVTLNEASSMVAEMARWQLRPDADPDQPDLSDMTAEDLTALLTHTQALLDPLDFTPTDGAIPSIDALKMGAGHVLRNLYVQSFGAKVSGDGQPVVSAAANTLSDTWEQLLGFRPLALTRVVGNGLRIYNQGENRGATETGLINPIDAVMDHLGNVYVTEQDAQLIRMIPKVGFTAPYLGTIVGNATVDAGNMVTIAGQIGSTADSATYNADFAAAAEADGGVPLAGGFAVMYPNKLALETPQVDATKAAHLYFSSPFARRIFLIPTEKVAHFDHQDADMTMDPDTAYGPGKLYPIAGSGTDLALFDANDFYGEGEGGPATAAPLGFPTGITRDAGGNVWLLDSARDNYNDLDLGRIRVVRESDGVILTLPIVLPGTPTQPYLPIARDIRVSPDGLYLYIAATKDHFVFRVTLPSDTTLDAVDGADPASWLQPALVETVVGSAGNGRSFQDGSLTAFPDVHDISDGLPVASALLNSPYSIDFDADDNLLIADSGNGRIRLLKGGSLYTIGGGLDTRFLAGDARLGYFPSTTYLNYCATDRNVLVVDSAESIVRRIWTARGSE